MAIERRRFLTRLGWGGLGLLSQSGVIPGRLRPAHAAMPVVVFGAYPGIGGYAFSSRDWSTKYGIKTEFKWFSGGGEVDNALVAGQIDADSVGAGRVVSLAAAKPGEIAQIMTFAYGDFAATLVRPDSPYKTMADLKGKKVGTAVGSGAYMAWLIYLDANGFKLEDFEVVNIRGADIPAALSGKVIDAATVWEPFPALMEHQGIGRIIQQFANWVYDMSVVQVLNSTLARRRDDVVRLVAALLDCQEFIRKNPTEAAKFFAQGLGQKGAPLASEPFEVIVRKRLLWNPELTHVEGSLQKLGELTFRLGKIRRKPVYNFRHDILEDAKKLRA